MTTHGVDYRIAQVWILLEEYIGGRCILFAHTTIVTMCMTVAIYVLKWLLPLPSSGIVYILLNRRKHVS